MGSGWPERFAVDSHQLTVLRTVLAAVAPQEGCALLLGDPARSGPGAPVPARLRLIWPCLNVWPASDQRFERFAIDPREQLLAQKWGRRRGWQVLGSAHSHPSTAAVPSATDCAWTFPPALMLILGASGEVRAWWIAESAGDPSAMPAARELALVTPVASPSEGGKDLGE